ncbi:PepSY-associated TM helix domain-containing protein [Oceanospirillum linum]|uniref:Peptidase n=1 Tax=Oceanospirillum linum TaxID=966 RepID=A0A1T1H9V9_OCELI|nr:PepSY-associated TM helix domain-containing protein [Oceanospirillum linum]OOV86628.1 hypothetical protein BTA35_0212100 [Oceanospirillum linum]SEG27880.1 hypothetical protein SAMN04489856_107118 [Oleiphilus messinensis]SMP27317.1 hypothetical protein SAMN06264348_10693 [Oceanospirillum linum]
MLDKLAALFPARTVRVIHIYSSMMMLFIMLFFTITGITLNHPDWFRSSEPAQLIEADIPQGLLDQAQQTLDLHGDESDQVDALQLAVPLLGWIRDQYQVRGQELSLDWDADEAFLVADIQQPGGYSIAEFDLAGGAMILERKDASLVHQLNDLHKGRNTGDLWRGFIDFSAVILLLFTLSGFWLLLPQKKRRRRAFSVSGVGLVLFLFLYWHTL